MWNMFKSVNDDINKTGSGGPNGIDATSICPWYSELMLIMWHLAAAMVGPRHSTLDEDENNNHERLRERIRQEKEEEKEGDDNDIVQWDIGPCNESDCRHHRHNALMPLFIGTHLALVITHHQHPQCPSCTHHAQPKVNQLETELTAGDTTSAYLAFAQTIPSAAEPIQDSLYALSHPLLAISVPIPANDLWPACPNRFLINTGVSMTFMDLKLAVRLGWSIKTGAIQMRVR
ncbi:hypothetical protein C366_02138 [Cryptococcus neoformans Tu401-1]|nr:hypothetical protein C366_02138 [Cryptococcus neoformans var. grubii Tu401-1]